jgi:hypothetical protein
MNKVLRLAAAAALYWGVVDPLVGDMILAPAMIGAALGLAALQD